MEKNVGRVCLVGAGPGDPGLITVLGLDRLRRAQVIVVDALVSHTLLEHARPDAQVIDAGKRGGRHKLEQEQINDLLVQKAKEGLFVVRLKGGDPYVFGRGAEEAMALASRGVAVEVIPGVTAGIAAPAAAGIPLTHRQVSSSVTFVTGHEDPSKDEPAVDYDALAKLTAGGGTLCFYMGLARLGAIAGRLAKAGLAADTPVAVIQWGATALQQSVRTTLAAAPNAVADSGLDAPAVIVIGAVAAFDEPGLNYFTSRPLFGRRVVITRTRQQASELRIKLADAGADVLEAPTIELVPPPDWSPVDQALRDVKQYDWLVLTSVNGVATVVSRLEALGLDARHLSGVKLAAIGDATADALRNRLLLRADVVPQRYVAEALAEALIAQHDMAAKRVLMLRADIARPALPKLLADAGAQVTELVAYQTKLAAALPHDVLEAMRHGRVDWITFTSSSTARNLVELLGEDRSLLQRCKLASIGPITSGTMRQLGLEPTIEATTSNLDGLIEAMVRYQPPASA